MSRAGWIPPVESGEADESSVPADQSAMRLGGRGCQVGIVNIVSLQAKILTPAPPPRTYPLVPLRLAEKPALLNHPQKSHGLLRRRRSREDVRMRNNPQESHFHQRRKGHGRPAAKRTFQPIFKSGVVRIVSPESPDENIRVKQVHSQRTLRMSSLRSTAVTASLRVRNCGSRPPVAVETGRRIRRRRGAAGGLERCSRIASSTSLVTLMP